MANWTSICNENDLSPGTGICALLGKEQIAIFKLHKTQELYAINNYDPIGKANVLSRGITGSIGENLVVASPLYKQHFNLQTGACLEHTEYSVKTYPIRIIDGDVQVSAG